MNPYIPCINVHDPYFFRSKGLFSYIIFSPPEPPKCLPVALALEIESVVVITLAMAVTTDMRIAQRYHLRDLTYETSCLHPLVFHNQPLSQAPTHSLRLPSLTQRLKIKL